MCGILAMIATPWQAGAAAALATLRSRGPDAQSLVTRDDVILGHARLSVIDLEGGAQPMTSADDRHSLVFNGEIYNFQALRRELEARGHRFLTRSDTEVILHGYREWKSAVVERLDGMFAFALWDAAERRLFAARDRLGIKPLFYAARRGFACASTLAPFLALPGFPRDLDYEALRDYLAFQTPLAPASLLREVRQLPPAHRLEWSAADGALRIEPFWHIPQPSRAAAGDMSERVEELDALLRETVEAQLVADVPLGAFLSGGIDSSLMVHYMAQAGAKPLRTFSMRFAAKGYDESPAALEVARRYATEHHVIDAPRIDAAALERAIAALDQPLADPAYVTTVELSRATRGAVTVAISGDGGDELFGGYPRFLDTAARSPDSMGRRLLRFALRHGLAPGALLRRSLAGADLLFYRKVELGPWDASRKSLSAYLTPEVLGACRPEATLERWRQLAGSFGGELDTASLMRADLWTYLSDNCLAKTDRASMAHGLEVRVPLLGNRVVEFALARPAAAHVDPNLKAMLSALARARLPQQVWNRPKHGFSVPLLDYFRGSWRARCEQVIAEAARRAPFLRTQALEELWTSALAGRGSRRLAYTFIVLLLWMERWSIG